MNKLFSFYLKSLIVALVAVLAISSYATPQTGTMTDTRDGKKYKTVQIGEQVWMAENLDYETRDSYCYENDESNCSKYGRLYKRNAAKKACPIGWHLPRAVEFDMLIETIGGNEAASKLKSKTGWNNDGNGTDSYGFAALPAGVKSKNTGLGGRMVYKFEGDKTYFWSSNKDESRRVYYMESTKWISTARMYYISWDGFSVRCLKGDFEKDVPVKDKAVKKGTLVDKRDGKKYKTVKIGNQTWMAENLNYKTHDSYCYEDEESNCSKYGRLYEWSTANRVCPDGWYLPTAKDFQTLWKLVGERNVGESLKSRKGWENGGNGTDAVGFAALPAGSRDNGGWLSNDVGLEAWFWSSTDYYNESYSMNLSDDDEKPYLISHGKSNGFSVRCIKD